jgi:hypothetical protein
LADHPFQFIIVAAPMRDELDIGDDGDPNEELMKLLREKDIWREKRFARGPSTDSRPRVS